MSVTFIYWVMGIIVSYMVGIFLYAEVDWRKWYAWLNPYDFSKGIIDGNAMRVEERVAEVKAENEARHTRAVAKVKANDKSWDEKMNAEIDETVNRAVLQEQAKIRKAVQIDTRRRGEFLQVQDENHIDGVISGGVEATPQDYLEKYGPIKSETERTLEKLKRIREASDDFAQGH